MKTRKKPYSDTVIRLRKTMKRLSRCPLRDSNPAPMECKYRSLRYTTLLGRSTLRTRGGMSLCLSVFVVWCLIKHRRLVTITRGVWLLTRESIGTYFTRRTVVHSETKGIVFNLINKKKNEKKKDPRD
jgi:hypothetical protein